MKIAIQNKEGDTGFYKIDGRKLDLFIKKAEEVNGELASIWTYTGIKRDSQSNVGLFENVKVIK